MQKTIRIKSKNALLELLEAGHEFEKITIAEDIIKDDKIKEILKVANEKEVHITKLPRKNIKRREKDLEGSVIFGYVLAGKEWSLDNLIDDIYNKNETPFFLVLNNIRYAHNAGAIMRTAFAAGVNGIIVPKKRNSFISEEVLHISMGTALRVPLVETNIFDAINKLNKNGIRTFSLDMGGPSHFKEDLTGPVAFILGAEDTGVSSKVNDRADKKISIPMKEGIDSLNVSVTASLVIYEKIRQENFKI